MNGVTAEVAEEVFVFFEDGHLDTSACKQETEHYPGGASADDAAGRFGDDLSGFCHGCDEASKALWRGQRLKTCAFVLDSSHPILIQETAMRWLRSVCFVAASVTSCAALAAGVSDEEAGKAWWAHVQYLADDSMRGRLTGSEEYLKAAAYVVDKFKSYGLQPAGLNGGFYQPVKFDVQRVVADKSSMSLVVDGKAEPLVLGTDAILGARSAQAGTVEAPLVFIGYGLHLPEAKYDDFDSAEVPLKELKGKVVVFINGGPADLPGPLKSYARTAPFTKALRDVGAVGAISIPTPKSMDFGWQRVASGASQPGMRLAVAPDADASSSGAGGRGPGGAAAACLSGAGAQPQRLPGRAESA